MWVALSIRAAKIGLRQNSILQHWRLGSNAIQKAKDKLLFTTKSHLPVRLHVRHKNSLIFYAKLGVGIVCGVALNCPKVNCEERLHIEQTGRHGDVETEANPDFNWLKFLQLLRPHMFEFLGAAIAALACALLNILIPGVLKELVDILSTSSLLSTSFLTCMKKPATKALLYYLYHSFFTFCYISLLSQIGEGMAAKMKGQLFSTIIDQDIAFFDKHRTGELINRLIIDVHDFKSAFKMVVSQGLRNSVQVIGCSITLFKISPQMSLVMMIILPTVILVGSSIGSVLRRISSRAKSQASSIALVAQEAIANVRVVRSFAMEDIEKELFNEESEKGKRLEVELSRGIALLQAGSGLFLNGMVLGTVYMGGHLMRVGSISPGDLMSFLVSIQILQRSFSQLTLLFGTYIKGLQAGARVFAMMDLPPGLALKTGKIIPHHSFIPDVELNNVGFSYPSRPEHKILKNVTLKVPANSTVAIVGPSGSGKSTIASLIERFYDVDEGTVSIGGENIRDLDGSWLRGRVIGFISQEPLLFATTIMDNIRYGNPDASDSKVVEAAKLAHADEFIRSFPEGYRTKVGERGVALSGGQRQRIAIARALLKNPAILILDEATSALDAQSEKLVQQALDDATKSRTTIVIAHRLSTVRKADLIVVLNEGRIVEMGTHSQLMKKGGIYAALAVQQMSDSLD